MEPTAWTPKPGDVVRAELGQYVRLPGLVLGDVEDSERGPCVRVAWAESPTLAVVRHPVLRILRPAPDEAYPITDQGVIDRAVAQHDRPWWS